jgi:hypothetical protein
MLLPFAAPLYLQGMWVESHRQRRDRPTEDPQRPVSRAAWVACQGIAVGLLLACILVFRSRASFDFIYLQF